MTNRILFLLITFVLLVGCKSPKQPGNLPPPEGDLAYLLNADPANVTMGQLNASIADADSRVLGNHVVEGIYWQAIRYDNAAAPNGYGSGGDSLLFTGMHLASRAYHYGVTRDPDDLTRAIEALRGIYILTHISGTPGSLMRGAFPTDSSDLWHYPAAWQSRIDKGFVYDSPTNIADPFSPGSMLPQMTFYTRVTRDQITGLVYGLSVFERIVDRDLADPADVARIDQAQDILAQIVDDVYQHLRGHDFKIRDQTGRNDTRSDSVGHDLLRLSLLGLYRLTVVRVDPTRVSRIVDKYHDLLRPFKAAGLFPSDPFNVGSNAQQYYAWNLRLTRVASVWLTANPQDKEFLRTYTYRWMFRFVRAHKNAWFSFIYAMMANSGENDAAVDASLSLKSWSLRPAPGWPSPLAKGWGRPYDAPNIAERVSGGGNSRVLWPHLRKPTTYWTWQKDPWDVSVTYPTAGFDGVGLDLILPYWMARYHGLIR
jgi:hypothetical protein